MKWKLILFLVLSMLAVKAFAYYDAGYDPNPEHLPQPNNTENNNPQTSGHEQHPHHSRMIKSKGVYIEGNLGIGLVNEEFLKSNTGVAGNAAVGYKFCKNIAAEVGVGFYPNKKKVNSNNNVVDIAIVGLMPSDNGFVAFGKLGLAMASSKPFDRNSSTGKFTAIIGAGLGYAVTYNLQVSLQGNAVLVNRGSGVPKMYMLTLGASYIF